MSTNGQPDEQPAAPTIVRRNHGTGHVYTVNSAKFAGVTTALNNGYPKPALVGWAADEAGRFVLNRWDELVEMQPSERYSRVRNARFDASSTASKRGREVHDLAYRYMVDPGIEVPDELKGFIDAYIAFVQEWDPQELFLEAPVASLTWSYSGTPDLVADLADGDRWLLDLKTGAKGIYSDAALQLAAYRYAEWILGPDGVVVPMPAVDRVGAIWLRDDDTYQLCELDAGPATHRLFLYVLKVAEFAQRDRDDVIGPPLEAPTRA